MVDLTCQCIYLVVIYLVLSRNDYEWINNRVITVITVDYVDRGQKENEKI